MSSRESGSTTVTRTSPKYLRCSPARNFETVLLSMMLMTLKTLKETMHASLFCLRYEIYPSYVLSVSSTWLTVVPSI